MLTMSAQAQALVTSSWTMRLRVESWRGATLLDSDVPVSAGSEQVDRSAEIPERVTLTVPRLHRGVNYDPTGDPDHPLAPFGQQLRCSIGVELGNGQVEWLRRGTFLVHDTETEADTVTVNAVGLLSLIREARFVLPFQPTGTFASTLRDLIEPALTATIDAGLTDRAVPGSMQWDNDRLKALYELLDAWPAAASMSGDGYLVVEPQTDPVASVLTLTDGAGGTVVRAAGGGTREGAYTVVVARGEQSDGAVPQGVAYDTDPSSPLEYGGPFNPLPVPYYFSSPLLTDVAQCQAAAAATLARLRRSAAKLYDIDTVPHPGLQVGDGVEVTAGMLDGALCVVEQLTTPYSPGVQSMRVRVL